MQSEKQQKTTKLSKDNKIIKRQQNYHKNLLSDNTEGTLTSRYGDTFRITLPLWGPTGHMSFGFSLLSQGMLYKLQLSNPESYNKMNLTNTLERTGCT